jgi:hypothetical protein
MPERRRNGPIDVLTPFFGTLEAKVAFVLDYAAVSLADDLFGEQAEELLRVDLLWALQGCRFNETIPSMYGTEITFRLSKIVPISELALNRAKCVGQWITPKQEEQGH